MLIDFEEIQSKKFLKELDDAISVATDMFIQGQELGEIFLRNLLNLKEAYNTTLKINELLGETND